MTQGADLRRRVFGAVGTWLIVIAAVAVPVAVARHLSRDPAPPSPIRVQVSTAAAMLDDPTLAEIERFSSDRWDAPLVVSYHDVRPAEPGLPPPNSYTVSPDLFASHIAVLKRLGFQSMTVDEFVAWNEGAPLNGPRVLLTFDDGPSGLWRYADPILRDAGMTGVAFVITGRIGTTKYYLNWSEVAEMHASGRWQFGGHTAAQHTKYPSDVVDNGESQLVRRFGGESNAAGLQRVADDLDAMSAALVDRGIPAPTVFSWPFSMTDNDADPAFASAVVALVCARFPVNFTNAGGGQPLLAERGATKPRPRLELFASISPPELAASIVWLTPLDGRFAMAADPDLWMVGNRRLVANDLLSVVPEATTVPPVAFTEDAITFERADTYSLIAFGPRQSPAPAEREFQATLSGLRSGRTVQVRLSEPATTNGRALVVSDDTWSVIDLPAETLLASGTMTVSDTRRVAVVDDGTAFVVRLDGAEVVRLAPTPSANDTIVLGVGTGDKATSSDRAVTFNGPTLLIRPLKP